MAKAVATSTAFRTGRRVQVGRLRGVGVTGDLPTDVRTVLAQLFAEARAALDDGDVDTAREVVESAETVVATKLPEGDRRDRLRHGCDRVRALVADDHDTAAAAAYLAAMERRLPDETRR